VAAGVLGIKVGIALGLASILAVAGPTDAENPALISAASTVFAASVSFVATLAPLMFVTVTTVVMTTPATRIRMPMMIICLQYKAEFLS
jgi:hypothetical protein